MLKKGDVVFDSLERQIIIQDIKFDMIKGLKKITTKITSDNDDNTNVCEKIEEVSYEYEDLGKKIFLNIEDILNHNKKIINDERYFFNYENILNFFEEKNRIEFSRIEKYIPKGKKINEEIKQEILSSYIDKERNNTKEKNFIEKYGNNFFARIDLDTRYSHDTQKNLIDDHFYEKVYLTKGFYKDLGEGVHFVNWRSPIADLYYNNEKTFLTRKHYLDIINEFVKGVEVGSPFNVYEYELLLKRKYRFSPFKYINLYIKDNIFFSDGTMDPFLIDVFESKKNEKSITDIIKSIQASQYNIIREKKM